MWKNKYTLQMSNIRAVKTSWAVVFCRYTHMCTISKDISINKEKEICPPSKESMCGHRCRRTNVAAKCEMFMNCSKNCIGICQKTNMTTKQEYVRDHRCERTHIPYKCKIFETVNLPLHGHYTHICTMSKVIGIGTEKKIHLQNK